MNLAIDEKKELAMGRSRGEKTTYTEETVKSYLRNEEGHSLEAERVGKRDFRDRVRNLDFGLSGMRNL